jgi:hypothetical protein
MVMGEGGGGLRGGIIRVDAHQTTFTVAKNFTKTQRLKVNIDGTSPQ